MASNMNKNKFSKDRYPLPGELCTVTDVKATKVSALLFDKIYASTSFGSKDRSDSFEDIPEEMTFGVDQFDELALQATLPQIPDLVKKHNLKNIKDVEIAANQFGKDFVSIFAIQISEIYRRYGVDVIPTFQSFNQFRMSYSEGQSIAYQAALNNLPLVAQDGLSWKQVIDFREDRDARNKYRSLRLWLSDGLKATSINHATELIAKRIQDYEWAIKKHGLKTVVGAFSKVVSLNSVSTIATGAGMTAIIGGPIWAAIVAGAITSAEIGVWLCERRINKMEMEREDFSDIAILYEAKTMLEKTK